MATFLGTQKSGALLLSLLFLNTSMLAAPGEMKLRWSELEKVISGHTISLSLPDGHYLEGKVVSIGPDTLEADHSVARGFVYSGQRGK